jgi:hypothetical protein
VLDNPAWIAQDNATQIVLHNGGAQVATRNISHMIGSPIQATRISRAIGLAMLKNRYQAINPFTDLMISGFYITGGVVSCKDVHLSGLGYLTKFNIKVFSIYSSGMHYLGGQITYIYGISRFWPCNFLMRIPEIAIDNVTKWIFKILTICSSYIPCQIPFLSPAGPPIGRGVTPSGMPACRKHAGSFRHARRNNYLFLY